LSFLSSFRKRSADDPPAVESWPLLAFGKLPVYKDFISAGLTDDASREFRDWLSDGFSKIWSARDDCRAAAIPPHAFLLRLPASRKTAAGVLWGSTDQGGLRRFPFALFTILPPGKPAAAVLSALDYLPVLETRAREIRRKYDAGGSLAEVYQELRGARIDVPVRKEEQVRLRLAEALAGPRVGGLARSLFENDAAARWPALLSGVDAAARHPAAGAAAFRLPLAEDAPLDQLKLWTARLAIASAPTGVLYRTNVEAPRGVVFFRDLRAEDILLFHPGPIPTDFVEEIPPGLAPAASPEPEPEPEPVQQPAPEAPRETAAPGVVEEFLTLGAAADPTNVVPAPTAPTALTAPTPPTAPPTADPTPASPVPTPTESAAAEPIPEPPAAVELPAPAPVLPPDPAGWDLPLASLLAAG
jgi:type VI secretion system ImpM family protein